MQRIEEVYFEEESIANMITVERNALGQCYMSHKRRFAASSSLTVADSKGMVDGKTEALSIKFHCRYVVNGLRAA